MRLLYAASRMAVGWLVAGPEIVTASVMTSAPDDSAYVPAGTVIVSAPAAALAAAIASRTVHSASQGSAAWSPVALTVNSAARALDGIRSRQAASRTPTAARRGIAGHPIREVPGHTYPKGESGRARADNT